VRVLLLASSLVLHLRCRHRRWRAIRARQCRAAHGSAAAAGGARISPAANERVQVVNDFMTALAAASSRARAC
jgi:hypothetical protein